MLVHKIGKSARHEKSDAQITVHLAVGGARGRGAARIRPARGDAETGIVEWDACVETNLVCVK
mgnify:CR=1 FL=1